MINYPGNAAFKVKKNGKSCFRIENINIFSKKCAKAACFKYF